MFAMGTAGHDYAYFELALRSRNFAAARAYAHGSRLRLPDGLALLLLSLDEPSPSRDWYGRPAARWHAASSSTYAARCDCRPYAAVRVLSPR